MRVRKPSFSNKFKPAPQIKHGSRVLTGFGGVAVLSAYLMSAPEQCPQNNAYSDFQLFHSGVVLGGRDGDENMTNLFKGRGDVTYRQRR